jgi:hypothetical protein
MRRSKNERYSITSLASAWFMRRTVPIVRHLAYLAAATAKY